MQLRGPIVSAGSRDSLKRPPANKNNRRVSVNTRESITLPLPNRANEGNRGKKALPSASENSAALSICEKKFDDRGHLGNKAIWPRAYRGGEKMRENPGCPNYAFWEGDGGGATDAGQITEVPMMRAIHQAVPGNEVIKSNVHLTAV